MPSEFIGLIRSRKAAHWGGVILGMSLGIILLPVALMSIFGPNLQTPLDIIAFPVAILAELSVLPLAIVAITRPRFSAKAICLSWLLFMAAMLYPVDWWRNVGELSLRELGTLALCLLVLPGSIVALLLLASGGIVSPGSGRVQGVGMTNPRHKSGAEAAGKYG